ncbi:NO-inducible flavohemoprotein [Bacillus gobiensis]|uniref:NO-inducible flavohemoprotein n=1 Tax=Bacillus gobiensis TaxID=1441095 RepID=UPI003D1D495A
MLNPKTIEIIKSTVPVLEKHGKEITTRFYQMLFEDHPELLNIFNQTNQKTGRQQTALANAVYAAAAYIDKLETIIPVVKQIAHKHRSIGIKPEHYPIVGKYLLLAIEDVVKDVPKEVIEAWGEAYGVIADIFIQTEHEMYVEAAEKEGGWKDYKPFAISRKVKESDLITSIYLKPKDGKPTASFLPGQYISVRVNIPGDEYTHIRQYSLSDAPNGEYYRITIKRESEEKATLGAVSNYLHDQLKEGDSIEISAPAGEFVLDQTTDKPLVLISGGVGVTPLMSMLKVAAKEQPNRDITFIQAARSGRHIALDKEIQEIKNGISRKHLICYETPTAEDIEAQSFDKEGYITSQWLNDVISDKAADYYLCGPIPFMKAVYQMLLEIGVQEEAIHYELFGPHEKL